MWFLLEIGLLLVFVSWVVFMIFIPPKRPWGVNASEAKKTKSEQGRSEQSISKFNQSGDNESD